MTNDGNNTLVYDAENRTVSASNGGASGAYTFDANSLRVKKVSGATTTVYIFSGSKVIAEYENGAAPGSPTREYIYSGSTLLAKIDSSGTNYYHQDHLSNRLVTNSSGTTVAQLAHFPFGEPWYNASNDKLLFTSYERDSESGNDYAMMRSYINRLGRFSSPDPADLMASSLDNPQSLNRYSYVLNNPLRFIDPKGLDCVYLTDEGDEVESIDHNSDIGECQANGGYWANGWVANASWVSTDPNSDNILIYSQFPNGSIGVSLASQTWTQGAFGLSDPAANSMFSLAQWIPVSPSDAGANGLGRALNATGIQALNPDVCGGGYFVGRGAEFETGVAHGGAYVLVTHDSRSGNSVGYLVEAGGGPVSVGHEGSLNTTSGKADSSNLLLFGVSDHLGGFAGVSGRNSPFQLGAYGAAFGRIGGAYVNLVPGGGCHP